MFAHWQPMSPGPEPVVLPLLLGVHGSMIVSVLCVMFMCEHSPSFVFSSLPLTLYEVGPNSTPQVSYVACCDSSQWSLTRRQSKGRRWGDS